MRFIWLTDIHLNFVPPDAVESFLAQLREARPEAVLISGDIAESRDAAEYLARLDDALACPLYFVLGNHDFYFGSLAEVRVEIANLCKQRPKLKYLTALGVEELAPGVGLVGHDGWADGRIGDYERSYVMMNDYRLIRELSNMSKEDRWPVLMRMGDEAADHVRRVLPAALERYPLVYFLTHVPPFREACWHEGRISDDEWAPHFTCQAVGEALLAIMRERPDRRLTVLCGHTHGSGQTRPLANVRVITGGAVYGSPAIAGVFEI
jgi:Icc protein